MKQPNKIKYDWKMKYGQKFYECSIEVLDDEKEKAIVRVIE
jgi:hypothetical protein